MPPITVSMGIQLSPGYLGQITYIIIPIGSATHKITRHRWLTINGLFALRMRKPTRMKVKDWIAKITA
jgi:hypothetical protein